MTSHPAPALTASSGRVKAARRLAHRTSRAEHRLFLAEGPQAVHEALATPGCVREVFALSSVARFPGAEGVPWLVVDERALAALAETVSPQGVVAVCGFVDVALAAVLGESPRLLAICAEIRDPGNAGTIIRCADAAGADGVVIAGESVDPYNGKAVRASVGSLFHLPVVIDVDPVSVVRRVRDAGLQLLAADGEGEADLDDIIDVGLLARPTGWLFGNEARGLPDDLAAQADHRVRIPIHGRAESLNLATAAAVCLYASARAQRALA
ncbi:MAG: TrmH family RNA methyltransferase [Nocardioidaceae bacterium]